jgi:hypothetical protein
MRKKQWIEPFFHFPLNLISVSSYQSAVNHKKATTTNDFGDNTNSTAVYPTLTTQLNVTHPLNVVWRFIFLFALSCSGRWSGSGSSVE